MGEDCALHKLRAREEVDRVVEILSYLFFHQCSGESLSILPVMPVPCCLKFTIHAVWSTSLDTFYVGTVLT